MSSPKKQPEKQPGSPKQDLAQRAQAGGLMAPSRNSEFLKLSPAAKEKALKGKPEPAAANAWHSGPPPNEKPPSSPKYANMGGKHPAGNFGGGGKKHW